MANSHLRDPTQLSSLVVMRRKCELAISRLIPRLHDRANIEQTSSKRRANIGLARPTNI